MFLKFHVYTVWSKCWVVFLFLQVFLIRLFLFAFSTLSLTAYLSPQHISMYFRICNLKEKKIFYKSYSFNQHPINIAFPLWFIVSLEHYSSLQNSILKIMLSKEVTRWPEKWETQGSLKLWVQHITRKKKKAIKQDC